MSDLAPLLDHGGESKPWPDGILQLMEDELEFTPGAGYRSFAV